MPVKHFVHMLACCSISLICLVGSSEASQRPADATQDKGADLSGDWGGLHLSLSVTEKETNLEFDCAHGRIDVPLRGNARNRFSVRGTYVQEHGGPVRLGEVPKSHPALYTGRIKGTHMTVAVRLLDTSQRIGAFTVTRDQRARVFKCK